MKAKTRLSRNPPRYQQKTPLRRGKDKLSKTTDCTGGERTEKEERRAKKGGYNCSRPALATVHKRRKESKSTNQAVKPPQLKAKGYPGQLDAASKTGAKQDKNNLSKVSTGPKTERKRPVKHVTSLQATSID